MALNKKKPNPVYSATDETARGWIGTLSNLITITKSSIVNSINEIKGTTDDNLILLESLSSKRDFHLLLENGVSGLNTLADDWDNYDEIIFVSSYTTTTDILQTHQTFYSDLVTASDDTVIMKNMVFTGTDASYRLNFRDTNRNEIYTSYLGDDDQMLKVYGRGKRNETVTFEVNLLGEGDTDILLEGCTGYSIDDGDIIEGDTIVTTLVSGVYTNIKAYGDITHLVFNKNYSVNEYGDYYEYSFVEVYESIEIVKSNTLTSLNNSFMYMYTTDNFSILDVSNVTTYNDAWQDTYFGLNATSQALIDNLFV